MTPIITAFSCVYLPHVTILTLSSIADQIHMISLYVDNRTAVEQFLFSHRSHT